MDLHQQVFGLFSDSTGAIIREPAWGWQSARPLWNGIAAGSGSNLKKTKARPSALRCRSDANTPATLLQMTVPRRHFLFGAAALPLTYRFAKAAEFGCDIAVLAPAWAGLAPASLLYARAGGLF